MVLWKNEMEAAIEIKKLSKSYPGRVALNEISFSVKKGSVHGFLGPNGAGKSTTMKILSGLIPPTDGEFKVNGKVGFLPEHPPLYPNMSVRDYLVFVQSIYSSEGNKNHAAVESVIQKTGLSQVSERLIGNLSKGYQQRVGIAQALVHSPEIIILDEPTVGLDPSAINEIRELIKELKKDHTILFSSHQLHDVELLCSDITLIDQGKIVVSGPLDKIVEGLKTRLTLKARVEKFSESERTKMLTKFKLDSLILREISDKKEFELEMSVKAPETIKKELAKYLASDDIGLLEFAEVKIALEDLFNQMIQ
jgi:ABC-2 type transport system ATP-binding protein